MILSVSRRTDIPACYADWFFRRLQEGYVYVANPFNPRHISRIMLNPSVVDAIVFWTKNPIPMLSYLDQLSDYPALFQFTLTPYTQDLETRLPDKETHLIPAFRYLANLFGPEHLIWRYDPIIFTETYTPERHLSVFSHYAAALTGCTSRVIISFIDFYQKTQRNMQGTRLLQISQDQYLSFAASLRACAQAHGMYIQTCAEEMDLLPAGIPHGACIDPEHLEQILHTSLHLPQDKGQRKACLCAESIDIGAYNTCINGCRYCYANTSASAILKNRDTYDPNSSILCRKITEQDKIFDRKMESLQDTQYKLF